MSKDVLAELDKFRSMRARVLHSLHLAADACPVSTSEVEWTDTGFGTLSQAMVGDLSLSVFSVEGGRWAWEISHFRGRGVRDEVLDEGESGTRDAARRAAVARAGKLSVPGTTGVARERGPSTLERSTPGPWTFDTSRAFILDPGRRVVAILPATYAEEELVRTFGTIEWPPFNERRKNGPLIARAPDLELLATDLVELGRGSASGELPAASVQRELNTLESRGRDILEAIRKR